MISSAFAENFDSIYNYKSVITAFNEGGYHIALFSTQTTNRSYQQFFAEEDDTTVYLSGGEFTAAHDGEKIPQAVMKLKKIIPSSLSCFILTARISDIPTVTQKISHTLRPTTA